jgi:hypothetical protein
MVTDIGGGKQSLDGIYDEGLVEGALDVATADLMDLARRGKIVNGDFMGTDADDGTWSPDS